MNFKVKACDDVLSDGAGEQSRLLLNKGQLVAIKPRADAGQR